MQHWYELQVSKFEVIEQLISRKAVIRILILHSSKKVQFCILPCSAEALIKWGGNIFWLLNFSVTVLQKSLESVHIPVCKSYVLQKVNFFGECSSEYFLRFHTGILIKAFLFMCVVYCTSCWHLQYFTVFHNSAFLVITLYAIVRFEYFYWSLSADIAIFCNIVLLYDDFADDLTDNNKPSNLLLFVLSFLSVFVCR